MSESLGPHGLQHTTPLYPSPTPGVYSNSCLLSQWCHPAISSSVIPFSSCLQSFPASRSFSMSWLFASKDWSFSFCISPSNEHSGLTGLISLVSKGLSSVFSSTTVGNHQFFSAQPDPVSRVSAPWLGSLWDCQFQCQLHYSSDLGKVT